MNAVASGVGADHEHEVAGFAGAGADELVYRCYPDAHRVDERIGAVAWSEDDFTTDRWQTEAVAVPADTTHHALEQVAVAGGGWRPEAQGIECRDGPCAHGEDVAHDAADARGCPLERLDGAGMIVALDLHYDGEAIADGHRTGVFLAGPDQHVLAIAGEPAQQRLGVLIAAVLAPHRPGDA